jgi:formylglycine-generating enzyme required for sulfatase activity
MDIGAYYFTRGNSASGSKKNTSDATETAKVAWYTTNSTAVTHQAKTTTAALGEGRGNALGLYDMSGNVWEFTSEKMDPNWVLIRGGVYNNVVGYLQIGFYDDAAFTSLKAFTFTDVTLGFRVAQSTH